MMRQHTLRDWTPDQGDGNQWLARLESEGWVPEYGACVRVRINGRDVVRYAFLATDNAATHTGHPRRSGAWVATAQDRALGISAGESGEICSVSGFDSSPNKKDLAGRVRRDPFWSTSRLRFGLSILLK